MTDPMDLIKDLQEKLELIGHQTEKLITVDEYGNLVAVKIKFIGRLE